jgi:GTP 3',8-cyclase
MNGPLIDKFGRIHRSLRISVTDRCNIRCQYCMPAGNVQFIPRKDLLSYENLARLTESFVGLGVTRIRLTGGEPLVRTDLHKLVALLKMIRGVESLALTTNGMLLPENAQELKEAGLDTINVSLDTLREETFREISRRPGLDRVLAGIDAALSAGFRPKLNTVLLRGINEEEALSLVEFALSRGLTIRFIEYMPLDAAKAWDGTQMISGAELRRRITQEFGVLEAVVNDDDPSRPSKDFRVVSRNGGSTAYLGKVGFIDSVSAPFCGGCDRLRLTAEGHLRNCLFGKEEWNLKSLFDCTPPLDDQAFRSSFEEIVRDCVDSKYESHGIGVVGFSPPKRTMHQIGG